MHILQIKVSINDFEYKVQINDLKGETETEEERMLCEGITNVINAFLEEVTKGLDREKKNASKLV